MVWGRQHVTEARNNHRDVQVCSEISAKMQRLLGNYARRILSESGKFSPGGSDRISPISPNDSHLSCRKQISLVISVQLGVQAGAEPLGWAPRLG